jgi:lipoyl(octanoyl) transferase
MVLTRSLLNIPYAQAVERQRQLIAARLSGAVPDLVWYLEHPPVVTWNPARGLRHLKAPSQALDAKGVRLEKTDRGGDITYHGPGQLVGYPIVQLTRGAPLGRDVHSYLRALEEGLIQTLALWRIEGFRVSGKTGVWVHGAAAALGTARRAKKIAAIGVRATRWVMSHGFALNISCDLAPFRELIVPCGIRDAGVTSMRETTGLRCLKVEEIVAALHRALEISLARRLNATFDGSALIPSEEL